MSKKQEIETVVIEDAVITPPTENYHVSPLDIPKPKPTKIDEKNIIYHVSK